jgi:N utilization substance protein B
MSTAEAVDGDRPPAPVKRGNRRSAARLAAVQAVYEIALSDAKVDAVVTDYMVNRWDVSAYKSVDPDLEHDLIKPDKVLFKALVEGVCAERAALNEILAAAVTGKTPFDRLDDLLCAVLLCGVYELTRRSDAPVRVVIDEYVHVAHAFFDDDQPALVNGALDKVAATLNLKDG